MVQVALLAQHSALKRCNMGVHGCDHDFDFKKMYGEATNVNITHRESASCTVRDGSDHQSLRTALESRIDPMNPVTHVA